MSGFLQKLRRKRTPQPSAAVDASLLARAGGHALAPLEMCRMLAQGHDGRASPEDIYFCFRLLLGRAPNSEEVPGHMDAVGLDLVNCVRQYLNSQEFAARDLLALPEGGLMLVDCEGYALYVDPEDDAVGKHVTRGGYETHVASIFRQYLKPGNAVVDIGANLGYFTALAAHLVGPTGQVVSIEPNARNCRYIEATRRHNGFGWQSTHCLAASDRNAALVLNSAYSNGSVSQPADSLAILMRSTIVPGVKLDDILKLKQLDFIKIDVEGHEWLALQGFQQHLNRFQPLIVSEFSASGMHDPVGYLRFLHELGYDLSAIQYDGSLVDFAQDAQAVVAHWRASGVDHIDILAVPKDRA